MARRILFDSTLVSTAALAVCLAVLLATSREAEAAFPGQNGSVAFTRITENGNNQVFAVRPDGTDEERLTNTSGSVASSAEPSYSADGKKIAWNRNGDIWTMDADGSGKRRLTSGPATDGYPAFSPDGRSVAFTRYDPEERQRDIFIKTLAGGLRRVTDDRNSEGFPSFRPDGLRIAFGFSEALPGGDSSLAEVATVRTDGTGRKVITDTPGQKEAGDPDWSPDGRTLVYTLFDNGREQTRIKTIRADGTGQRTLFSGGSYPVFSPDGTQIAFYNPSGGNIRRMRVDGTGATAVTDTPNALDYAPSWGPKPRTGG